MKLATRRGTTLVETLVVGAVMSVVLGLITVSLHSLYRAEGQARRSAVAAANLERLAERFRGAVHAARSIRSGGDSSGERPSPALILELQESRRVEFSFGPHQVTCETYVAEKRTHRETFVLRDGFYAQWLPAAGPSSDLISLRMMQSPPAGAGNSAGRVWGRIDAVLGLDYVNQFGKEADR